MNEPLDIRVVVKRKDPALPRFVEIDAASLSAWDLSGTTPVTLSINQVDFGRRNLKPWGQGRDVWFIELTQVICETARINTGDKVELTLQMASTALPHELSSLIASNAEAKRHWEALTSSQKRMLGDHVRQAKQAKTRERRALKGLVHGNNS